jgi:hypothetical protein
MRKSLLLFLSLLFLPSCSREFSDADLAGTYVASYKGETATLSVKPDHSYTHVVQLKDGQITEAAATWKGFTGSSRQTAVEFLNFRVIPSYGEAKEGWVTGVDRTWSGRVRLCFDEDVDYCYVKRSSGEG